MYYDVVVQVEPKRNALREATDTLNAANTKLAEVKELVQTLETNLAALTLGIDLKLKLEHKQQKNEAKQIRRSLGVISCLI